MYIDAVDFDVNDWELKEFRMNTGSLNGSPVCILGDENAIESVKLNSGIPEGFSLKNRKIEIKPMMNRIREINVEYKHTNSDGSSDTVRAGVSLNEDKGGDTSSSESTNSDNDSSASDINSSDQDSDSSDK